MTDKFEQWAIVEIMGHQRYAGLVTEQVVGGTSFLRVDVPKINGLPGFTKLFGSSAIYAMTIVDEETARAAANADRQRPLDEWSARQMLEAMGKPVSIEHDGEEPIPFSL